MRFEETECILEWTVFRNLQQCCLEWKQNSGGFVKLSRIFPRQDNCGSVHRFFVTKSIPFCQTIKSRYVLTPTHFVPLCLCAFVPLCLCAFVPLCLCAFVPSPNS